MTTFLRILKLLFINNEVPPINVVPVSRTLNKKVLKIN